MSKKRKKIPIGVIRTFYLQQADGTISKVNIKGHIRANTDHLPPEGSTVEWDGISDAIPQQENG